MAQYDLTNVHASHLDRHMVLPLLEFIQERQIYDEEDMLRAKLELVSGTKMVDFAEEEYKKLHKLESLPADSEINKQRTQVYQELEEGKQRCAALLNLMADEEKMKELRAGAFRPDVLNQFQITELDLDHLYAYAKLNFECGLYKPAADYLLFYRQASANEEKKHMALWGKLEAETLLGNWDAALEDIELIQKEIDSRAFVSQMEQLKQRTCLIHWSLFAFSILPDGRSRFIDFVFEDPKIFNTIQSSCPHILRYLTAAVIITKRRDKFKDLSRMLRQECEAYSDPLTEYYMSVYVEFDFKAAQQKMQQCKLVVENDFFLQRLKDDFLLQAQLFTFETLCRVHKSISLNVLANYLGYDDLKMAEPKIVELIRQTRTDARIDSDKQQLVMGTHYPSIHQVVIDKTKVLAHRSIQLAGQIDKKYAAAAATAASAVGIQDE